MKPAKEFVSRLKVARKVGAFDGQATKFTYDSGEDRGRFPGQAGITIEN
jgi:hypothetical protein